MIEAMNGAVAKGTQGRSPRARAMRWLADAIAAGTLRPGDAVPTVNELSATLGVARNTAAAALVDAERCRLIERRGPNARKRFVPDTSATAPLSASTVCVLGELGRFSEGRNAPRWSDAYLALELVPRLSLAGKHVMFLASEVLSDADIDSFFRSPPAGMVVTSSANDRPIALHALARCREAHVPAVVYGNAPELRSFDRVYTDHRAGARMLTEWLLKRGCRHIMPFFPHPPINYWMNERLEGYSEAMRAARLKPHPCVALGDMELRVHAQGERRFSIFRALAMSKIVELRGKGGVDALLCLSDEWVPPVIAAIRDLGLEPNRDILVAGYDNIVRNNDLGDFEKTRPIVTIEKHNERSAADLAALLLARMDGKLPPEPQARTHDQELVVLE